MKKSFFAASLLAAGFAFAGTTTITNDCIIGVMPVKAKNLFQVILSVPWVQEGGGVDAIAVSNLVKTAGLIPGKESPGDDDYPGDTLSWYDSKTGKYVTWRLVEGGNGTNYWKSTEDGDAESPSPDRAVLLRGGAVVLARTEASTNNITYVIGQVGTNATVVTSIAPATDTPTFTLVAPPSASVAVNANELTFTPVIDIDNKDRLILDSKSGPVQAEIVRKNVSGEWKWVSRTTGLADHAMIPAGRGFMYRRVGTTPLSVTWSAPSVTPPVTPPVGD